jgi:hypothetical protein
VIDPPQPTRMQDADEIDPGEPLQALANFEQEASRNLIMHIRRSIQRRTTVGQLAAFSVRIPLLMLKEFLSILITRPDPKNARKGGTHGDKAS